MLTGLIILANSASASGLDDATKTIIKDGFGTVQATAVEVIGFAIVAGVAVVAVSAGAKFALKQIKGLLSKAG